VRCPFVREAGGMNPKASEPRDDPEREPAQAFQSEDGEHRLPAPVAPAVRIDSGPAAAYQHEDGEPD
jgi:hypothetical protein